MINILIIIGCFLIFGGFVSYKALAKDRTISKDKVKVQVKKRCSQYGARQPAIFPHHCSDEKNLPEKGKTKEKKVTKKSA